MDFVHCCYFAKFLVFDALMVASCWGLGWLAKPLLKATAPGAEEFFFRVILGSGVWVALIFLLGICHGIYKINLEILIALSLCPVLVSVFRKRKWRLPLPFDWLSLGLMIAAFIPSFWYSMYPARFYDDLNYHLPVAKFFLTSHSIDPAWHLRFPVLNQATDLLFVPLQAFCGDIGAQQLSVVSCQLIILGIFCCARRFGRDVKAGQLALLACLTSTRFIELSNTVYIEMNFALFCFAATYAWLCALDVREKNSQTKWSILTGLFLGLAISSNLFGVVLLALFALVNLFEIARAKFNQNLISISTLNFVWMLALTIFVWIPWMVRNFVYSHNPFFPFAADIFGLGEIWDGSDKLSFLADLHNDFGLTRNFANFISLPLQLSHPIAPFTGPSLFPTLFLALILALPLSFLPHSKTIARLTFVILSTIIIWFYFGHDTNFLIALAPAVAVLSGITLSRFWVYIKDADGRRFSIIFTTATVLVFGAVGRNLAFLIKCDSIPTNNAARAMFLNKWVPISRSIDFANSLPKGVLYAYKNPYVNYYYQGKTAGDTYGVARYDDFSREASNSNETLSRFLKKLNVTYLIVEEVGAQDLVRDKSFDAHFHQLYKDDAATLYLVR